MSAPSRLAAVLLAAVLLGGPGCTLLRPAADARSRPEPVFPGRPLDGLLVRPDLQALVDAQVRRDGPALIAALTSPDVAVRARAAFALGSVQDPAAVDALLDALRDDAPAVRADAAFALGQTADSTRGVALLIALRTEATPTVQAELIDALGKTGRASDADELAAIVLPDAVEPARSLALGRMAARGVTTPALVRRLVAGLFETGIPEPGFSEPTAAVREASARAFERMPVAAVREALPTIRSVFAGLAPDDPALASLVRALGRVADPQDAGALAISLGTDDDDWRARVNAAAALGAMRAQPEARAALVSALTDANPHVAAAAATALARVETPSAGEVQAAVAASAAPRRPWQASAPLLPLLARAGRLDAVDTWGQRFADPFAQTNVLAAYGAARTPASLDALFARSGDADARLAAAAVEGLRARWAAIDTTDRDAAADRYYAAFASALARRDLATTTAAAPVLSDPAFIRRNSATLLRTVYGQMSAPEDIEPMVEIIGALGAIRDGQEVEFLVGVALTGHPALRLAARNALNERLVEGIDISASGTDGATETTGIDWPYLARVGARPRLVLDTDRGRVVIEMDTEGAPQTVQTISVAAASGRYDGVPFHRVVSNFVVQGGDFFRRDGYGGPAIPIRSEFTRRRYATGTAGIASAGKDTEGVQFFVTHSPTPHLDGRYTVFGRVVTGQDVVDRLLQGDIVRRAHIER